MDNNKTTNTQPTNSQVVLGIVTVGVIIWGTMTVCEVVKNIGLDMVDKVTDKIKSKRKEPK